MRMDLVTGGAVGWGKFSALVVAVFAAGQCLARAAT
jgi:hypothetical protein